MTDEAVTDPVRTCEDRGSVMPMVTILIAFLMIGGWALLSATQQWNTRRDVHAVAAAAARAAAQGDQDAIRSGGLVDPDLANGRAQAILAASGHSGSVIIDGATVTVTVFAAVNYAFPAPGFPPTISGSASAVAVSGVDGTEGG